MTCHLWEHHKKNVPGWPVRIMLTRSHINSIRVRPYYKQNHKYLGELIVHNDSDDAASAVGGGAGRGNGKILYGHTFVNTHQNCTKFPVVVYCVDIESKFQLICIIYTMISTNSMLTKHAFTAKNFV